MGLYRYEAVSAAGQVISGEMEAGSEQAVVERLQVLGHLPVRAEPARADAAPRWWSRDLFGRNKVSPKSIALLTRELATLLEAGLPLDRSLEILIELGDSASARAMLGRVLDRVRGGASMADAIAEHREVFPRLYHGMVRAGEAGGSLEVVMARLATLLDKSIALREQVKSALIYPIILLVMVGVSVVVLLTVVLPQFRPLFEEAGQAMPLSARLFLAVGDGLTSYGWILLGLLVVAGYGWRRLLRQPAIRRQWDAWLLGLPIAGGLVSAYETALFCRTLGALLRNGLPLPGALAIARETVGNAHMGAGLEEVMVSLNEGRGFAAPLLQSKLLPPLAVELVHVGEETGRLDDMLGRAADIYDGELQRSLERLLALLVPVLTIALGALVAAVIASMLSAILSINDLAL